MGKPLDCPYCNLVYYSKSTLSRHINEEHWDKKDNGLGANKPEEAPASISDAELRKAILKAGLVRSSVQRWEKQLGEPIKSSHQEIVEIGIDDLMQLFHQYQHPKPVNDTELRTEIHAQVSAAAQKQVNAAYTGQTSPIDTAVNVDAIMQLFHSHHKALSLAQEAEIQWYFVSYSHGGDGKFGLGNCYIHSTGKTMSYEVLSKLRETIAELTGDKNPIPLYVVPLNGEPEHLTPTNKEQS